jgi:Protein of unknown function (DUF3363)
MLRLRHFESFESAEEAFVTGARGLRQRCGSGLPAPLPILPYEDVNGRRRLSLAKRSDLPVEAQVTVQGATWIDRQLLAREPAASGAGFGAEVRDAMARRVDLAGEGLARRHGQRIVFARDLLHTFAALGT